MQTGIFEFAGADQASVAMAAQIIPALQSGIELRGAASLLVPGGRTPLPLFEALRNAPLEWDKVRVSLTDERWVDESHVASNAALVRRELLQSAASAASFLPLFDGQSTAGVATESVWRSLGQLPRPLDVAVLGMGEDGHFASLFPGNDNLESALSLAASPACVAMRAPVEPGDRISLNLAALLQVRRLFLLVTGSHKKAVLKAAATEVHHGRLPVAALLQQNRCTVEVYWAP